MTDGSIAHPWPIQPAPGELNVADRGTRLAAAMVDSLIYSAGAIFLFAAYLVGSLLEDRLEPWASSPVIPAVLGLLGVGIFVATLIANVYFLKTQGQTIGKRLLGIRIVRSDGAPATLGRLLGIRILLVGLLSSVPLLGSIFSLTDVCFIFREDRRCIHDLMADTVVVKA